MSHHGRALTEQEKADQHARKVRRISDLQLGPVKSLPMTMFMLWMAGSDIHIFSIMMTGMAIYQPLQALGNTGSVFKMFSDEPALRGDVMRARLIYMACCLVALGVGLAKLHFMGLLPTSAVDWIDHATPFYQETTTTHFAA
jgi:hypothetical protein